MNRNQKSILQNGKNNFTWVGKPIITEYSFQKDILSERTGFVYSRLGLTMDIKDGLRLRLGGSSGFYPGGKDTHGNTKQNIIYCNSKDDFKTQVHVDFKDRFDKKVLDNIHESNFIKVKIEKDVDGKLVEEKFITMYDTIEYLSKHLTEDMTLAVLGESELQLYNGTNETFVPKFISLITSENPQHKATFTETILLDKSSIDKKSKDGAINIYAYRPHYIGKIDGKHTFESTDGKKRSGQTLAFPQSYIVEYNEENKANKTKFLSKFLSAKKGVTEITVTGHFKAQGVEIVEVKEEDMSDELKMLLELGLYTKEEIMSKAVGGDNSNNPVVKVIDAPFIQKAKSQDGQATPAKIEHTLDKYRLEEVWNVLAFEEMMKGNTAQKPEEDEDLSELFEDDDEEEKVEAVIENTDIAEDAEEEDELDWLNDIE